MIAYIREAPLLEGDDEQREGDEEEEDEQEEEEVEGEHFFL